MKVVEQQLRKDEIIDADDIKEHIVDDLDIENEALGELLGDVVPLFDEEESIVSIVFIMYSSFPSLPMTLFFFWSFICNDE